MDLNDSTVVLRAAAGAVLLSIGLQQGLLSPEAAGVLAVLCFAWSHSPWRLADGAIGGPQWFVRA